MALRHAVGGIFNIAAGIDLAVFSQHGRSDHVLGVWAIGFFSCFACFFNQKFSYNFPLLCFFTYEFLECHGISFKTVPLDLFDAIRCDVGMMAEFFPGRNIA